MSGTIQARLNRGYGIAASRLGAPYGQYRETGPLYPLNNSMGWLFVDFDRDPRFSHKSPNAWGHPTYYGLFDATNVLVGDYLVGPYGAFFVGNTEPDKPPLLVLCNRKITVTRPAPTGPYSGDTLPETTLMAGWPASVLTKSRGDRAQEHLPGDTRIGWYECLLPVWPSVEINEADRVIDENGTVYTVSSTELTPLGWRLAIEQAAP